MEPLTQAQKELYDWLVDYIQTAQHAPSIRQMMRAMNLRSPAPIQSRLEHLRSKGYIDWTEGKARTIRILSSTVSGVPVLGAIAAGGMVETFTDGMDRIDLSGLFTQPGNFALRVTGDSMIEALIREGDLVIMQPVPEPEQLKNGQIVAARVEGYGTTLKHFYREEDMITLQPANSNYPPIEVETEKVEVQGVLVGVWRSFESNPT